MSLRFYIAGSAESDNRSNWRSTLTDRCWADYDHDIRTSLEYNTVHPADILIHEGALPGGFDYVGAYIFGKGHQLYTGFASGWGFRGIAPLHRQSLDLCDVLWAWLPGCGEGTWLEIGYAIALGKPVVFATDEPADEFDDEMQPFSFAFANGKRYVRGTTPREAWDRFIEKPMAYLRYEDYLSTDHWQQMRSAVFEAKGKFCQRCFSRHNLHVHHLTYERVGREQLDDLIPLCAPCHQFEHSMKDGVR